MGRETWYGFLPIFGGGECASTCLNHIPAWTEWKGALYACHDRPDTQLSYGKGNFQRNRIHSVALYDESPKKKSLGI